MVKSVMGGFDEGGGGGVFAELPGHDAAEVLSCGELGLVADGDGIFKGPEGLSVEEPRGVGGRVPVTDVGVRRWCGGGFARRKCGRGGLEGGRRGSGRLDWMGRRWDGCGGEERLEVGIGAVAADALAGLEESITGGGNGVPAVAVERQTEEEPGGGDAGLLVVGDACFDRAAAGTGDSERGVERGEEAGDVAPWAAVVVVHDADLIDEPADGGHVDAGVHAR